MIYQLPNMFLDSSREKLESGFLIEKSLFPSLGDYVYKKDFAFLKDISNPESRKEVGK
jgi:hypothetical protein